MVLIGSVLRYQFDLCPTSTAILRVVRVGGDADFLDGFFVGRNNRSAPPIQTVHGDAVNLKAIRGVALTVGVHLHLIFGCENSVRGVGAAGALATRSIL